MVAKSVQKTQCQNTGRIPDWAEVQDFAQVALAAPRSGGGRNAA